MMMKEHIFPVRPIQDETTTCFHPRELDQGRAP